MPVLLSGGAQGADTEFSNLAVEKGIEQIHYSFAGHKSTCAGLCQLTHEQLQQAVAPVQQASYRLGKSYPRKAFIWKLIHRNWFQVVDSQAVYAIADITANQKNVQGGTGWAVAMAITSRKIPIFVFDQTQQVWFTFDYSNDIFIRLEQLPVIYTWERFTGIGTRKLSEQGKIEIRRLFSK